MQFKADMTMDELKEGRDPLHYLCFPLGKLSLISDMICRFANDAPREPFYGIRQTSVDSIHQIIRSAVEEIEVVQEAADAYMTELEKSRDELAEKLKALMPAVELAERLKVHPSKVIQADMEAAKCR